MTELFCIFLFEARETALPLASYGKMPKGARTLSERKREGVAARRCLLWTHMCNDSRCRTCRMIDPAPVRRPSSLDVGCVGLRLHGTGRVWISRERHGVHELMRCTARSKGPSRPQDLFAPLRPGAACWAIGLRKVSVAEEHTGCSRVHFGKCRPRSQGRV